MLPQPFLAKPSNRWFLFVLVVLAFLSFGAMWHAASGAMRMKAQAAGTTQYLSLKPGDSAKVVIRVTATPANHEFTGTLLEKQNETRYKFTSTSVQVHCDQKTSVLMGHWSDVRTGAILYVTGTIEGDRTLRANQLVVLTEYVTASH